MAGEQIFLVVSFCVLRHVMKQLQKSTGGESSDGIEMDTEMV